jgi:hypothetical protein
VGAVRAKIFHSMPELNNKTKITSKTRITVTKDQVSCEMGAEAVILHIKDGVYYGLDEVGAAIWKALQQPRSIAEIVEQLQNEYAVDVEQCERDVFRIISEMADVHLVTIEDSHAA